MTNSWFSHFDLFVYFQFGTEGSESPVDRGGRRGGFPLHQSLSGRLFPAVLRLVVFVREPEHHQVFDPSSHPPSTHSSGRPGGGVDLRDDVPTVQEGSRQRYGAGNLGLRLLLPLHIYVRESQPQMPSNRISIWTAAPDQDLFTGGVDHGHVTFPEMKLMKKCVIIRNKLVATKCTV